MLADVVEALDALSPDDDPLPNAPDVLLRSILAVDSDKPLLDLL